MLIYLLVVSAILVALSIFVYFGIVSPGGGVRHPGGLG